MRTKDALWGPTPLASLAEIYVMVGDYDAALDELDYLLTIPSPYSTNWLRLAHTFDPLRDHPGFQALLEKYE